MDESLVKLMFNKIDIYKRKKSIYTKYNKNYSECRLEDSVKISTTKYCPIMFHIFVLV